MILNGKVMKLDHATGTGVIRDLRGKEFFFRADDCKDAQLPPLHSFVTFMRDEDFKSTNVATLVSFLRAVSRV